MTASKPRMDNIDLLRAVAVMMVIVYHYTSRFEPAFYRASSMPFKFHWGSYGVDLFFAVSGYCIFMTLDSSGSLSQFWSKRLARIQPAYMAAIGLTFAVVSLFALPGREMSFWIAASNMVWMNAIPRWPVLDGVYWSLVVELKFYFWIGLIYYLSAGRWVSTLWAGFAAIGAALHLAGGIVADVSDAALIGPYSAAFLVGMVAYEVPRLGKMQVIALCATSAFLLAISPRFIENPLVGLIIGTVAFVVLRMNQMKVPRTITCVGLISYSLYLVHQNIGYAIIRSLAPLPIELRIVIALVVVMILAWALNRFIEVRWSRPLAISLRRAMDGAWGMLPKRKRHADDGELRRW